MNWKTILQPVLESRELVELKKWVKNERLTKNIYPEGKDTLRAFDLCPYSKVRVVIFGQDPYHSPGTADGLAFSTRQEKRPPSLEVIFKEIYRDLNIQYIHNTTFEEFFPTSNLEKWAKNGFLLLNTTLTVEEGKANSHAGKGWEKLIYGVIDALNKREEPVIFLLWGKDAKSLEPKIDTGLKRHLVFTAAHPAAELYKEGAGFYSCRHFSIVRDVLPMLNGDDRIPDVDVSAAFDKDKARSIIKEHYPIETDRLMEYIDQDMLFRVPVHKEKYYAKLKEFEKSLSTNYA